MGKDSCNFAKGRGEQLEGAKKEKVLRKKGSSYGIYIDANQ
jgi:hypothetical protein